MKTEWVPSMRTLAHSVWTEAAGETAHQQKLNEIHYIFVTWTAITFAIWRASKAIKNNLFAYIVFYFYLFLLNSLFVCFSIFSLCAFVFVYFWSGRTSAHPNKMGIIWNSSEIGFVSCLLMKFYLCPRCFVGYGLAGDQYVCRCVKYSLHETTKTTPKLSEPNESWNKPKKVIIFIFHNNACTVIVSVCECFRSQTMNAARTAPVFTSKYHFGGRNSWWYCYYDYYHYYCGNYVVCVSSARFGLCRIGHNCAVCAIKLVSLLV